jgi:hypothetical protein
LFNSVTPSQIGRLVAEAQHRSDWYRPPNFFTFFAIDLPATIDTEARGRKYAKDLVSALTAWESVQYAYFEPAGEEPENARRIEDPDLPLQKYLFSASGGIGADAAWNLPGGDGSGVQFIDIERCWTKDHRDLSGHQIQLLLGDEWEPARAHGTSVLGIVCALRNDFRCRGIAHNLDAVSVISWWGEQNSFAAAVEKANHSLNPGDVLLLEFQQKDDLTLKRVPAEFYRADFEAIRKAVGRGIIVIEAAGNAGIDIGTLVLPDGSLPFAAGAMDSGAIIVGAASSAAPILPLGSNVGSRVDCFAWGEKVYAPSSTGPNDVTGFEPNFDGTSSAAAIIAGTAAVMQGMAIAQFNRRLDSRQMRELLRTSVTATISQNGATDKIGVMPNLGKIVQQGILGQFLAQNPPY